MPDRSGSGRGRLGPQVDWVRAAACVVLSCAPLVALAQAAVPAAAVSPTLECQTSAWAAQPPEALLRVLPACQGSAEWLALLGRKLLAQRRFGDAAEHLERALLLDPDQPALQMDFALALAGSGDAESAVQLLGALLTRPDVPADIRPQIERARQDAQAALQRSQQDMGARLSASRANGSQSAASQAPDAPRLRLTTSLRVGHDSNLLGAPTAPSLQLTVPGGPPIELPLDASNRPRPGSYLRADARLEAGVLLDSGRRWDLAASLLARNSPRVPESDSRQAELVLEHSNPSLGWTLSASVAGLATRGGGVSGSGTSTSTSGTVADSNSPEAPGPEPAPTPLVQPTRFQTQGLSAGWGWRFGAAPQLPCVGRLALDAQARQLISNPLLSGRYMGVSGLVGCTQSTEADASGVAPGVAWWQPSRWQLAARWGLDTPTDAARPGGRQAQFSLRPTLIWGQLESGHAAVLDVDLGLNRDATGYSALLDNNARRRISRASARFELQGPLTGMPGLLWVGGVELSSQRSNISLFDIRSWGPYLAVRWNP